MGTSWTSKQVSASFDKYNDMLENILGFSHLLKLIKGYAETNIILDFGCGPGKVSERIALMDGKYKVIAVDQSQNMLDIAKEKRSYSNITYCLSENDELNFLETSSVDCVIACFVIITNESEHRIKKFISEIYRVLKPNGHFLILDCNPDSTGIQFSTFKNGIVGKQYTTGEKKVQYLKIPDELELVLHDWYWKKEDYLRWLEEVGFNNISSFEYKISDLKESENHFYMDKYNVDKWEGEQNNPPFIIYESLK